MEFRNSVKGGILNIDCRGSITSYSLSNPDCLGNILKMMRDDKTIKSVVLSGDFTRKLSPKDVKLLRDYTDKIKRIEFSKVCKSCGKTLEEISNKIFEDPVSAYIMLQDVDHRCGSRTYSELMRKMMKRTDLIKRANMLIRTKKIETPLEAYPRIFKTTTTATFIGVGIVKLLPKSSTLVDSYKTAGTNVKIYKDDQGKSFYTIKPPELKLHVDQVSLLTKAFEILSEKEDVEDIAENPEEARKRAKKISKNILLELNSKLSIEDLKFLTDILVRYTVGFGVIELLFKDPNLEDIYVDSPGTKPVHVFHSEYEECVTNIIIGENDLEKISTRLRAMSGRPFDEAFPVLHTDLDGFDIRVAGIKEPLTFKGTGFAFRKHRSKPWTIPQFIERKMMDYKTAGLLSFLIDGQASILVTGPRGSGKTSLLASLLTEIPSNFRMIVMEDTPEIPIRQLSRSGYKIQHIRTSAELSEGQKYEMSAEYALRTSLRLGESVLVIGEVRGGEAKSLFEAMRIGAAGNIVIGTIHGSSAYDTWDRIVNDIGVPSTSFKACDVVIACASLRKGEELTRNRRITGVTEVKKTWKDDPVRERGFNDLIKFNYKTDSFRTSSLSKSTLIKKLAKEKGMTVSQALANIRLRGKIKKMYVDVAKRKKTPELLELEYVIKGNDKYYELAKRYKPKKILNMFRKWLLSEVKNID
jgi:type IV secretory pathway ATPase VirB11/archaellum biosynthesis ATPase